MVFISAALFAGAGPLHAVGMCHSQLTACTAGAGGCIRLVTTLYPISVTADADTGYSPGGKCGVTESGDACGVPLGTSVCGEDGGSCDCGRGIGPCVQFPNQETTDQQTVLITAIDDNLAAETQLIRERFQTAALGELPPELAAFWRGLASLSSLHFRASVEVAKFTLSPASGPTTGAGFYEYWEQGSLYRVVARVGPEALGLTTISEMAFDGQRFAMLERDSGLVIFSAHDKRFYAIPMRNPLLLPLAFASAFNDTACPRCESRLADLRTVKTINSSPTAVSRPRYFISAPPVVVGDQTASSYSFLTTNPGEWNERQILELRSSQGRVLEHIEFYRFNSVPGASELRIPWTIVHQYNSPSGKPHLIYTFKIEAVEANGTYPTSLFRVDNFGTTTWNDDARH
jgi:hypothetical protein